MTVQIKQIEVMPYDPQWPELFSKEAALIKKKLGQHCLEVHHIGSTSVPGLAAKPILDIIVVAQDPARTITLLESLEYTYKGEYNIPFRFYFNKDSKPKINLHMYKPGNPEIDLNLGFRDYLRTHLDAVVEYAQLKAGLLTQKSSFEIQKDRMFTGYSSGKDCFIRKITSLAGFNKIRLMHCAHPHEWQQAKQFRKNYFAKKDILFDPLTWTFNHPEHIHFCFYQGPNIIGYGHLQLFPEKTAVLHIMEFDIHCHNLRGQFLTTIEQWLKEQKECTELSLQACPSEKLFYKKQGYEELAAAEKSTCPSKHGSIGMHKFL